MINIYQVPLLINPEFPWPGTKQLARSPSAWPTMPAKYTNNKPIIGVRGLWDAVSVAVALMEEAVKVAVPLFVLSLRSGRKQLRAILAIDHIAMPPMLQLEPVCGIPQLLFRPWHFLVPILLVKPMSEVLLIIPQISYRS